MSIGARWGCRINICFLGHTNKPQENSVAQKFSHAAAAEPLRLTLPFSLRDAVSVVVLGGTPS
jgi:hypothetical protein